MEPDKIEKLAKLIIQANKDAELIEMKINEINGVTPQEEFNVEETVKNIERKIDGIIKTLNKIIISTNIGKIKEIEEKIGAVENKIKEDKIASGLQKK